VQGNCLPWAKIFPALCKENPSLRESLDV
jgi:hypothetical protein